MKFFVFFSLLMVSCVARKETSESAGKPDTAAEAEIVAMLHQYYDDMSARDWVRYRGHFWEQATITTAWQVPGDTAVRVHVTTIDDFIKETPNGPDSQPVFEEKMLDSEVTIQGGLAAAWVNYSAKFGSMEKMLEWKGKDLFSLMHHEGKWKIISLAFESDQGPTD